MFLPAKIALWYGTSISLTSNMFFSKKNKKETCNMLETAFNHKITSPVAHFYMGLDKRTKVTELYFPSPITDLCIKTRISRKAQIRMENKNPSKFSQHA